MKFRQDPEKTDAVRISCDVRAFNNAFGKSFLFPRVCADLDKETEGDVASSPDRTGRRKN